MTHPTSIIIIDSHDAVRIGVSAYLKTLPDFEVVGEAASGQDALKLVSELVPKMVLIELIMVDIDGVEVTRRIKHISPRTQVVVLTSNHEDARIFSVLKAGAICYILKDVKMESLADVLRSVIQGEVALHPRVAARLLQEIQNEEGDRQCISMDFTDPELDILKLKANGLTNNQISKKLVISENTVIGHVSNILCKLHLTSAHR